MASTYLNDLRVEEQATGENSGTWGNKVNSAFSQIAEAFSYGTKQLAADSDETFTMPDGTSDGTRSLYLKITSAGSLTATRTVTLGPNTVSKLWIIENATTGSQSITIAQGSGGTVTIPTGAVKMVYSDGAGAGAAVVDALTDVYLASVDHAAFGDNKKAVFGAGSDLEIYSDGTTGKLVGNVDVTGTVTADSAGIGTNSPAYQLDVIGTTEKLYARIGDSSNNSFTTTTSVLGLYGDSASNNAGPGLSFFAGVTAAEIYATRQGAGSDGDLRFHTRISGTVAERLRIDSSGNLLLNTTANSGGYKFRFNGVGAIGDTDSALKLGRLDANTAFLQATSDAGVAKAIAFMGSSEYMRIDSSGNVNIGTTAAISGSHKLVIESASTTGTVNSHIALIGDSATNGQGPQILFSESGDGEAYAGGTIGFVRTGANSIGDMVFGTRGSAGDATTVTTEAMRIDSSGNLLVGTTSNNPSASGAGGDAGVAVSGSGYISAARSSEAVALFNRMDSDGEIALFRKDGTTVGSIGTTSSTMWIAGNSTEDTGIRFYTVGIAPCDSSGAYRDNSRDLGSSTVRWDDVYATNGTIQTSDRNEKQDIEELNEAEHRVAVACKGLLRKFRWKSSVEENGDDARIHFGIIAQDLQAAFEAEGLDAGRYAMFTHTTWTDEETGEERDRMGVRYSELLAFIIAAI